MERFIRFGIVKNEFEDVEEKVKNFQSKIDQIRSKESWNKEEIVELFKATIPNFMHEEKGKYLDSKM